ncbi:dihydroorotase [Paludibacterium sp. THUN1379]|uniref:dihydroorotase n=1 Tax=Paludibacterium sp. THUN1379 TaxID=3112107 RepID=UPI0030881137|nr:dihydroorotase [Paludibacterium sp. THUN1379]
MHTLTLTRPDDWHLHVRDGAVLADVLRDTCRQMGRAIIMPNLRPPVTTVDAARQYRERILAACPTGSRFEPLMTLYLTESTSAEEVRLARASGFVHGIKLYPAGATTNSDAGVRAVEHAMPALEAMAECGLPLLVHGEVTDGEIDVFDREAVFIERVMMPLLARLPSLRVVFEHITTKDAVDFVTEGGDNLAATLTAHHLLMNRNALFVGGIRPHHYCLPVLKREVHRQALLRAATSGSKKFFLGTDSAPHARGAKESACGCAGMYTAHAAIELYAEAFDSVNALDRLEAFASFNGPDFYHLPRNTDQITLERKPQAVPATLAFGSEELVPLRAGETLSWTMVP